MTNKTKKTKKKSSPCIQCDALCCRYIAVEIDEPTTKQDFDNIRWYLLHKKVQVFTSHDDDWYIETVTDCEWLGEDHRCLHYEDRPRLCRDHGSDEDILCEHVDSPYKLLFKNIESFEAYLDEKGINWRFKKKKNI